MKVFFEIDRIGDDAFYASKKLGGRWKLGSKAKLADPRLEPCVWSVGRGLSIGGRLPYRRDYSRANGSGSKGVYASYELDAGSVYKVRERVSWGRTEEYFIFADVDGVRKLSDEDLEGWVKSHLELMS